MGRVLTSQQITDGVTYPFIYSYNLSGALIEEIYPSGRVVKNTLNADGELAQVQSKKNSTSGYWTYADAFSYNAAGAVTKMQLGNGLWETAAYDPKRLQVTQIGLGLTDSTQNLLKLEFKYTGADPVNNVADRNNGSMREQKITVPAVGSNPTFTAIQTYSYDSLNRIDDTNETIGGNQTWRQDFSYDRYGNRRFIAANTTTLGSCPTAICNPTFPTNGTNVNRFSSGQGYGYDAAGNNTADPQDRLFSYDAENKQVKVENIPQGDGGSPFTVGEYLYDGEGKRVKKIVGSEVTVFVYDSGGTLKAEYSTTVVQVGQAEVSYLTADHLGSPRIVTDRNATVSSRKDFTAFGETVSSSQRIGGTLGNGYDPPNVRQDYTGYQKDDESQLEFAQARYYNTQHGRFTSVDPLAASATVTDPQSFNRYSYVLNKPTSMIDPSGAMGCGAQNSYSQCGGAAGFWGGADFGNDQADYNRLYGGLSQNIARGLMRRNSIDATSYDPELNIFHKEVTIEWSTGTAGSTVRSTTLAAGATLEQVQAEAGSILGQIFDAQTKEINQRRRGVARSAVNAMGIGGMTGSLADANEGFTFTVSAADNAAFIAFLEANFNSGSLYGQHDGQVGGCGKGQCADYRNKQKLPGIGGYMQVVFNRETRRGYLDVDRFNTYNFPRGTFGHLFLEVLAPKGYGVQFRGSDLGALRQTKDKYFR